MACIIDMSLVGTSTENKPMTFQDFKTFNKSGPDLENQLAAVEEYQDVAAKAAMRPRTPLANIFSRVSVLSFLPIFGTIKCQS